MNIKVKQFEQDVDVDVVVVLFFFILCSSSFSVLDFIFSNSAVIVAFLFRFCVFTFLPVHVSNGLNLAIVARKLGGIRI